MSDNVRPSWDEWALLLAHAVALRADCVRRRVGAVLMDERHRIVATGYNGAPSGQPGCLTAGACPRGQASYAEVPSYLDGNHDFSNCIAVHAEVNALTQPGWRRPGSVLTLYVTDEPCRDCSAFISEHPQVVRIVTPTSITNIGVPS